jgi:DNA invertase Pin-like site-specific DNA recombinase
MISKIQDRHRQKTAYVYIRQSTIAQVRHHQESTERQYALKNKALDLGWSPAAIRILDGDLGKSASRIYGRKDFKTLVADVSMGQVGALFALEASRLARSCLDWQRLLELCALTDTVVIDEDGCYDPSDFNDSLLLGLKGTIAQAELHFIRVRLQGAKRNKAKKGQLRFPLPVGLCYDDQGCIVLDPDQQVQGAVRMVFSSFRKTGSAYGVAQTFAQQGLLFPKRSYGGVWDGKLIWGRLSHGRVLGILKNPSYAGTYVFGRYRSIKEISAEGEVNIRSRLMPMDEWLVTIKNHHESYISWKEYQKNQRALERNRTNGEGTLLAGPARAGIWQAILHLRWQGGACEDIRVDLPMKIQDRIRYSDAFVERIRKLAKTLSDKQIVAILNQENRRSATGKPFSSSMLKWLRYKHKIPAYPQRQPGELTVKQVAEKFDISTNVVYYWISRGIITPRRAHSNSPYWIRINPEQEQELINRVENSSRIQKQSSQISSKTQL